MKEFEGPIVCSVEIASGEKMIPKLEFGKPIEDPFPNLSDEEFESNMIIPSLRKITKETINSLSSNRKQ